MAQKKRKRSRVDAVAATTKATATPTKPKLPVKRDLLQQCYAQVHTLRQYLLGKLPSSSRLRRKKIAAIGSGEACLDIEVELAKLLDNALVCSTEPAKAEARELRWQQWLSFSQQNGDESYVTISGTPEAASHFQTGIVDFVIWLLFTRNKSNSWPKHLLCDGFRKGAGNGDKGWSNIPGLFCRFPNSNVKTLKDAPWPQVLSLLGHSGERIMIDMLVDCSVFLPLQAGHGNYYQLSGHPLSEVDILKRTLNGGQELPSICRKPSDITFVRSRIFYAKPALTTQGLVQAGFKHIHVLNRCPHLKTPEGATSTQLEALELKNLINKTKVMMYIFPRQFKLHNVFTSEVDRTQTAQKFQDYTLREGEIASFTQTGANNICLPKTPKRLRHTVEHLTERFQILHGRCSYLELLRHYCPSSFDPPRRAPGPAPEATKNSRNVGTRVQPSQIRSRGRKNFRGTQSISQFRYDSVAELACPIAHVSAFCQAAMSKVIPNSFWGEGDTMEHNKKTILKKVHHFIKLRRFETMSLHEVIQDLKVVDIPWLQPPKLQGLKTSQTDISKRYEILHEFLYYVFDSFLIPLIRSNFYVTESNTHRYQIFYFRHDVWKRVAEPAMAALKAKMFEEVKFVEANRILTSRSLGVSNIRLLPKGKDLRPIMNLRKRSLGREKVRSLGLSINSLLGPVHTFMKLEQRINPTKLGSTMFSVNDIYTKLKDFKSSLGHAHGPLYFAKLDIRAAFDTIPQDAVVRLMSSVPSQDQYTIVKHAEVKPAERTIMEADKAATKPIRRWRAQALEETDASSFTARLEGDVATKKKNTVFINSAVRKTHDTKSLLALLNEHITNNLVKIGKKYYRQKTGIPQGSVLSSFLANYFYADLEIHHLDFLNSDDCLLLRLIDDFLLVTLDKKKGQRFVETLHAGMPDYGVEVSSKKTLVNFDMEVAGEPVNRTVKGETFPYCGTMIDMKTLEITKDREKNKNSDIANSLTIEFGRAPGQNFERKVLNAFKIQSHLMFFDTAHNTIRTVLSTLHGAFTETATKMWAYIRCMPKSKQPKANLVTRTIVKVIDVAFLLLTSRSRKMRFEQYACAVRKGQVALAACRAFLEILGQKQAGYTQVTTWLRKETVRLESK